MVFIGNNFSIKHTNVLVFIATIFFTSIGPIFNNLPIRLSLILTILFIYILNYRKLHFSKRHIFIYILLGIFLITNVITCIVNGSIAPLLFSSTFIITLFCAIQLTNNETIRIVKILTTILKYTIILAWIGYIYSLIGNPFFSLMNPNKVDNFFYLSTFSNTTNPVRPSGFYDEPGAFSFFICLLVFFRTYLGLDLKQSIFLMIGGFVTQSVAHAVFFLVWITSILFTNEGKVKLSLFNRIIILTFFIGIAALAYQSGIFAWAIERSTKWYEEPDSAIRLRYFNNAYEQIKMSSHNLIYGFNYNCINRTDCEGYSENLLTPIAMGGLMASWPFYLFLLFCTFFPIITLSNFSLIGIGLLILQRPYFLELPYSFCLAIVITLFLNNKLKNKHHLNE